MRRHESSRLTVLLAGLTACGIALAQVAPQVTRGRVAAVTGTSVTVVTAEGNQAVIALSPDWSISISAPARLTDIKPGSFIGTANVDVPGGGRSLEVHIFPPGSNTGPGHQTVMDAKAGSKMTNGTVGKVVTSSGGPEIDVAFPGGTRHVKVPSTALITLTTQVERSVLKPGIFVSVAALPGPTGTLLGRFISTGPNGAPPAR